MDPTNRTRDLTAMAEAGKLNPVTGRDDEILRCIQILCRRTKNNPVLIGEPDVGKSAIYEGLAERILDGDVPQELTNRRLISLDMDELMAGVKYSREFEDRLNTVFKEVTAGQNILIIDEIRPRIGAAGDTDDAMDVGNLLKPMLGRGKLQCIVATTLREYQDYIEKDRALERQFRQIYVDQPTVEDTISMLPTMPHWYYGSRLSGNARYYKSRLSDNAPVSLSDRYVNGCFVPDDAIDEAAVKLRIAPYTRPKVFEEIARAITKLMIKKCDLTNDTASKEKLQRIEAGMSALKARESMLEKQWERKKMIRKRMQSIKEDIDKVKSKIKRAQQSCCLKLTIKHKYESLNSLQRQLQGAQLEFKECEESMFKESMFKEEDIVEEVSERTWIPLSMSKMEKHLQLEEELHKRVVGQDHAVKAVAQAIQRFQAGFSDPHRPMASFMFMGPTGVGKTELAEALADCLFNNKEALVQIYMSNFMEDNAISRLVGPPLGYVGYEKGGQLTEIVLKKQYAVILFEEIEKAHPDVFNLLRQILVDGSLKDSQGQIVSFSNTVIIMTSNVGSEYIVDTNYDSLTKETAYETMREKVTEAAKGIFRSEFMNQVDDYIVFQPFDGCHIIQIVRLQLGMLQQKLAPRKIRIEVTDAAVELLGSLGYSPNCGARPAKRVIREYVQKELAKGLMRGEFKENDTVLVDTEATAFGDGQLPQQKKLIFKKPGSAHLGSVSPSVLSTFRECVTFRL